MSRVLAIAQQQTSGRPLPPGMLEGNRAAAFSAICRDRRWGGGASASGPGSTVAAAVGAVAALKEVCASVSARTLLDAGCGDFHWLGRSLEDVCTAATAATGGELVVSAGDLVAEAFEEASVQYPRVSFSVLDLVAAPPPMAHDVVLCRQCLNHMSVDDAHAALRHLRGSGSQWLLASTYPQQSQSNSALDSGSHGTAARLSRSERQHLVSRLSLT